MSLAVPLISSPTIKEPNILSAFKINSDTWFTPIKKSVTFSTIAVAPDVWPVIVLPTKFEEFPVILKDLKTLLDVNLPSDTLNICWRG